jgi:DNA-binding winged helix-turn-helix (wHTH) protein
MKNKFIINDRVLFSPSDNKLVPLGPRGVDVLLHAPVSRFLLLLILNNGKVVSQEEIYREVWEKLGQRVTPNALYQNVSLLRKALKKSGVISVTIKTHPKTGFSFHGHVQTFDEDELITQEKSSIIRKESENQALSEPKSQAEHFDSTTIQHKHKKLNVKRLVLLLLILSSLLLTVTLLSSSSKEHFTVEQEIIARVNGCPIYIDRGNKHIELSKILSFIREKNLRCIEHEFLYLTKAPRQDDILVMSCNTDNNDLACKVLLRLPPYLTPLSKR